jgi:hypothetical protein
MKDRWTELCESAVTELDRTKFRAILQELNQLLDEKGSVPGKRHMRWPQPRRQFDRDKMQSPR